MKAQIEVNKSNFFNDTFAIWKVISMRNKARGNFDKLEIRHGINHRSSSGSEYIITTKGVYRLSNHWGNVASCNWHIKDIPNWIFKQNTMILSYVSFKKMKTIIKN